MISDEEYIRQSIESNLIYCGSILEFTYSLEFSFLDNDYEVIKELKRFYDKFKIQMLKTINIANKKVSKELLTSNILYSQYMIPLYKLSEELTGNNAHIEIIENLMKLEPGNPTPTKDLLNTIDIINKNTLNLLKEYNDFITYLINHILKLNLFIFKYALYIEDVKNRATFYISNLTKIINKEKVTVILIDKNIENIKKLMERNALFINGFINQSEKEIIDIAREYAEKFKNLDLKAKDDASYKIAYEITSSFTDFITDLIKKLLNKKIQFMMGPAYLDICLREANDFKYNLNLLINKKT